MKKASVRSALYTSEKLAPKTIATGIASISVSVAKLLVLSVWGTVSTSGLYLMLFFEAGRCRYQWKWIGHARKLCRSRGHHADISFRRQLITINFRFSSAILNLQVQEVSDEAGVGTTGELRTKITGISSLTATETDILLGACNIRYKNTLAIGGSNVFFCIGISVIVTKLGIFKNRLPYNLYCVGVDVKHCTIQSSAFLKQQALYFAELKTKIIPNRLQAECKLLKIATGRGLVSPRR